MELTFLGEEIIFKTIDWRLPSGTRLCVWNLNFLFLVIQSLIHLCDLKSHGKANTGVTLHRHKLPASTMQTSHGRTFLHTEVVLIWRPYSGLGRNVCLGQVVGFMRAEQVQKTNFNQTIHSVLLVPLWNNRFFWENQAKFHFHDLYYFNQYFSKTRDNKRTILKFFDLSMIINSHEDSKCALFWWPLTFTQQSMTITFLVTCPVGQVTGFFTCSNGKTGCPGWSLQNCQFYLEMINTVLNGLGSEADFVCWVPKGEVKRIPECRRFVRT